MLNTGYFSKPSIHTSPNSTKAQIQGLVCFVCDDDLWTVPLEGGRAYRLTSNLGITAEPCFSPDGTQLAFAGSEGGQKDLYLMPSQGGAYQRLSFIGIQKLIGWKDDKTLLFTSSFDSMSVRAPWLYEFDIGSLAYRKLPYGPASDISYSKTGRILLGRNSRDSALWKRYRGGTAGVFWVEEKNLKNKTDTKAPPRFRRILQNIEYNLTNPHWVGDSIYFLSDHEGIAQIYTCNADGKNLKQLTNSKEFYVRNLKTDGRMLVYQCGADIYVSDLEGNSRRLEIDFSTPAIQAQPRFEPASDYVDCYTLNPKGDELAIVCRGQGFRMKPWSGGVTAITTDDPLKMKCPVYIGDGQRLLYARSTHADEESLFIFDTRTRQSTPLFPKQKWGKIWGMSANPKRETAVLYNNRNEIFELDLAKSNFRLIENSEYGRMSEVSFSPDGRYLVYTAQYTSERTGIRIYDFTTKELRWICEPVHSDWSGSFDQSGEYFYFLSIREFYPNYQATHFDLGFPFAGRPFVITLRQNGRSLFHQFPDLDASQTVKTEGANEKTKNKTSTKEKTKSAAEDDPKVKIDWENLEHRIEALPVKIGGYLRLVGLDRKLLYARHRILPTRDFSQRTGDTDPELIQYNFEKQKEEVFSSSIKGFTLNTDRSQICYQNKNHLRLVPTKELPREGQGYDKLDGWIRTDRIRLQVHPRLEWRQMYREAWELQKEHFWDSQMSKIDWQLVYDRYLPLLDRVCTRSEMSDLLWEMQGELGTSHCYEYMGDYFRRPPLNPVGYLGGDFKFLAKEKAYEIRRLYSGDCWLEGHSSPLLGTRAGLKPGDQILSIDGWRLRDANDLGEKLLNKAGIDVNLEVRRKGRKESENISVRTLRTQNIVLYREWVEKNRRLVHEWSSGKLGYVHIPDMMTHGYAEFYRGFLNEHEREGLVVDVRYNGGGHISQHILKILAQKVIGYDQSRWSGVHKYPSYAVNGPVVALTNELAGSDGDIFSHSFKLMKIGPLIGKRTWGGVIGINSQYALSDGTTTTQPEYSFWFKDVGWSVENYGTDPDIEVEYPPEAYVRGEDPQLMRAVNEALKLTKRMPPLRADLKKRPDLSLPGQRNRVSPSKNSR